MKILVYICIAVAAVSLIVGVISGITFSSLIYESAASAFLRFANTCLLLAIALGLAEGLKAK